MDRWATYMLSNSKLRTYQAANNARSLDDLPALKVARRDSGERWLWWGESVARARRIVKGQWEGVVVGFFLGMVLVGALQNWDLGKWELAGLNMGIGKGETCGV